MAKKLTPAKAREILHDKSVHGHPLTDKQRKFFGAISGGAPMKANGGWLDKFDNGGTMQEYQENYNDYSVSAPEGMQGDGFSNVGRNYSPAWGGQFAMGGSLPGSVGFTYARTAGAAPSEGPYAKKTLPSAQNGQDVQKQRYDELYAPIENKVFDAIGTSDNYLMLPSSTRNFLDKTIAGFSVASNRNIPPMDPIIKEVQEKVKKLPKEEISKLLKTDWSKIGMVGAMKNTPSSVGYLDMLKYVNHFNKLKKKGYTLQNGGEMRYYQEGLDWKPKTISRDGAWLNKFEYGGEIAQEGKLLPKIGSKEAYELEKARQNRSDATRAVPAQVKGTRESVAEQRKQELVERARKRKDPGTFSKGNYAIEESLRAFPESQGGIGELIDEYANPAYFIGRMASNLGNAGSKAYNTGDFSALPGAIVEPLVAGALGLDPLGSAMKVPGRVAQSMESGVLSNMPDITAIKNYPKELRLASEEAGKFTLPKYKDIYRMEPTSWTKDKLDPLSGRWFTDKPAELNFYLNNLKDENPLVNARLLKERVPERVWKERFGENMPLEAKQKSMGTGNFATMDDIINSKTVSPEAARDLYNGFNSELTWSEVQKSPSLFNPSEGIISDYDAYRLRGLKSNKPLSPYTKIEASREQMPSVLNDVFKEHFEKTKFGIPKKYVPFEKGGVVKDDMGYWNPDNHGKIVEISSPDITMEGVDQPLLGISDTGDTKLMQPGENYKFKGKKVTEYPIAQNGKRQPIYTDDPRKVQSYNDSLNLYKAMRMQDELMGDNKYGKPLIPASAWTVQKLKEARKRKIVKGLEEYGPIGDDFQNEKDMFKDNHFVTPNDKKLIKYYKSLGFTDDNIMYHTSADLVHPKIKAIGSYFDGSAQSPVYKKPVQPYILQEESDSYKTIETSPSSGYFVKNKPKPVIKKQVKEKQVEEKKITPAPIEKEVVKMEEAVKESPRVGGRREGVFGPNNSLIGYMDKNKQFTPLDKTEEWSMNPGDRRLLQDSSQLAKYLKNTRIYKQGGKIGVNQQDEKTLEQLDQLTNFTNYNKPQPGGWLNKYN